MKPIGVAIVGCGRISDLHELGYRGLDTARIVAVCDTHKGRAQQKAKAWGVSKVYTDYKELVTDPEIDLVELLVPHHLHAPMTVAACQAGKHVSVQKPMALTAAESERMIESARKAGVVLRVYENFVFYEPAVHAKQMIEDGVIGNPQMIRIHVNTGTSKNGWKVPLDAWAWRFNEKTSGGGELLFDHGYHMFSIAYHMMGEVEKVSAWIDRSPAAPTVYIDAPATVMFKFKKPRRYGVLDVAHTPEMKIDSLYYADDDRVEIVGEKGIIFINRYTARTVDLPELMLFSGGNTTAIPLSGVEWHDSFIACTRHLVEVLQKGGNPMLDGPAGKAVLQFTLAAQYSARSRKEVRPEEVD
jgi:predicted dehydrogenase